MIFKDLLINVSILVLLSYLYSLTLRYFKTPSIRFKIIVGIQFGVMAILSMVFSINIDQGVIFDGRSVILSIAGFFGGFYTAIIASIIAAAYRIIIGGGGTATGLIVIATTSSLGVIFRHLRKKKITEIKLYESLAFGFVTHIIVIAIFFTLPREVLPTVIKHIWIPFLTIFPFATVVIFHILADQIRKLENEHALEASEIKYRSLVEQSITGIYLFSRDKYIYVNNRFAEIFGYTVDEVISTLRPEDVVSIEDVEVARKNIDKRLSGEIGSIHYFVRGRHKKGIPLWVEIHGSRILLGGEYVISGTILDITDRVSAEKALRENEERLRLVLRSTNQGAYDYDMKTGRILVDDSYALMLGYEPDTFTETMDKWIERLHPDDRADAVQSFQDYLDGSRSEYNSEFRMRKANGEYTWILSIGKIISFSGDGLPSRFIGTHLDINQRKTMQLALEQSEKEIMVSMITGEDNERKRIAKEIHDGLGQNLTAASLNFNSIREKIGSLGPGITDQFNTGMEFLKSAIEESRYIAHNLMPQMIVDFGLVVSLKTLLRNIEKTSGCKVSFFENLKETRLDNMKELNLYRIAQEALSNILKHSDASTINLQLTLHKSLITLLIEDNGSGFAYSMETPASGMGLTNIRNRVMAIGGSYTIDSTPGKGTSILVEVELNGDRHE